MDFMDEKFKILTGKYKVDKAMLSHMALDETDCQWQYREEAPELEIMAQVPKVEEKPLSPFEITLLRKIDQIYNWQLQQDETKKMST